MTLSGDSSASSPVQHHYNRALELEKQLLTSIQTKGPFDPNVRILRNSIRELYESIILEDHEFAESHDVEHYLWRLHYTRIEDFRGRIRKSMSSGGSASGTAVVSSGSKPSVRREPVHKILAVFRSFLSEATGFYHDLILKISAKHGLSQDDLSCDALESTDSQSNGKRTVELKRCQLSCSRCLIYLGDLARYKEFYGDANVANHDWSIAAGFYVKAASLWPASGNPHNQLAVLATYVGDELLAVYHYFRSLAADAPFLTARDNLILLFEKNRNNYLRLVASSAEKPVHVAGNVGPATTGASKGKLKGEKTVGDAKSVWRHPDHQASEEGAVATDATEILKDFRVRFVRLNGILFTRTSLETFSEVHSCVLNELEQLLGCRDRDGEAEFISSLLTAGGIWGGGPNVVLQLVTILIFTVHNVNWSPDSHQPTYAEILQRSVILEHAFIATFECAGYLMRQCADADDASTSPLLPAMLVTMEWLACRTEMLTGSEVGEKEGNARLFFWRQCVNLLNRFLEEQIRDDGKGYLTESFGTLSLKLPREGSKGGILLWEDYELRGFTPLLPVQVALDYSTKPTMGLGSKKERSARVQRIIRAGKAISKTLEGTDKGLNYDVENDVFYVAGDRGKRERKRDVVGLSLHDSSVAETLEAKVDESPSINSIEKHRTVNTGEETTGLEELHLTKVTSGEEEDEVIVFKPLVNMKKQINAIASESCQPLGNAATDSNAVPISDSQPSSRFDSQTVEALNNASQQPLPGKAVTSAGIDQLLPGPLSSTVSSTSNVLSTFSSQSGDARPSDSATFISRAPGMFPDYISMNGTESFVTVGDNSCNLGPAITPSGSLAPAFGNPNGGSVAGLVSGPFSGWGSTNGLDMLYNQPRWDPVPPNLNWHPQDSMVGTIPWNTELSMLAAAKGLSGVRAVGPTMGLGPFSDPFPNLPQYLLSDNSTRNPSNMIPLSMMSNFQVSSYPNIYDSKHRLPDGAMHAKPSSQAPNVVRKDDILLHGQSAQGISLSASSTIIKPVTGSVNDIEKVIPRVVGRPSGMRPPPGFGPLPGRPPITLPVVPALESVSDGQPVSTLVQPKLSLDGSRSLSVTKRASEGDEQQVDDYGWLDGYTPLRREASHLGNIGQGSSVVSSDYGLWANPRADVTTSPFPGMKLSDRFSTSPPLPTLQKQQPSLIAQLQQEFLKHQQLLREQGDQETLQEHHRHKSEQFQQIHSTHIAAQGDQHQQNLAQQQQQAQQPQAMQPRVPQAVWYGQNYGRGSFVS